MTLLIVLIVLKGQCCSYWTHAILSIRLTALKGSRLLLCKMSSESFVESPPPVTELKPFIHKFPCLSVSGYSVMIFFTMVFRTHDPELDLLVKV